MSATLIVVRAVYFAATLQLFGLLLFDLRVAASRRAAVALAAAALVASLAWLGLVVVDMSGAPVSRAAIVTVLTETRFGELWLGRAALLLIVAATARRRVPPAVAAALILVLTAATGHAGAEGNKVQLAADAIHLLAAGAWLGGLIPFAAAMRRPGAGARARRFSNLGAACVGLIVVTGGVNSWFLVGSPRALVATDYGRVLILKLALFGILLAVASVNRFRLMPRAATEALRRNALIETALGLAIVTIVAVLGTMAPGYHMSP